MRHLPAVTGLGVALLLGGCAAKVGPTGQAEFDEAQYCRAFTDGSVALDTEALAEGDPDALASARAEYGRIAELAPSDLQPAWQVIVDGLPDMIADANGAGDANSSAHAKFRDAFSAIIEDANARCLTSDSTTS